MLVFACGLLAALAASTQGALSPPKPVDKGQSIERPADGMGQADGRDEALRDALGSFTGPRGMSDWELGWYVTAARMAGDKKKLDEATEEQRRRKDAGQSAAVPDGQRPMISTTLSPR